MKHKKHNKEESEKKTDDEEVRIDISKIKDFTMNLFTKANKMFDKQHSAIYISWILIILVILLSTYYRAYPATLPISKDWVFQNIEQNVKSQILEQERAGRTTLPDSALADNVEKGWQDYYSANKVAIDNQVKNESAKIKGMLQDDNGQTYLLAIDPYLWYSLAKWYERTGFYGNEIVDGKERFTLRNGRIGVKANMNFPAAAIVATHKIVKIFNPSQDIFKTAFWMPALLIGLAVIPAFFLGKKLGGNTGGFFAAFIFVLSPTILGRTAAGFSDTDSYTFIFPFLIIWLFLESIEAKNTRNTIILSVLTGFSIVLFRAFWAGWWFTFDLILGLAGVYLLYKLINNKIRDKKKFKLTKWLNDSKLGFIFIGIFIVSSMIFFVLHGTLIGKNVGSSLSDFVSTPLQPVDFILGFKGAAEGISVGQGLNYPLWPNVFVTVAELNPGSQSALISGGGGAWMVAFAIIGIILLLFKKKDGESHPIYGILLAVWMASTYYAGLIGVRFIALFAPVVAFGIAGLVGSLTGERMKKIAKKMNIQSGIIKASVVILILLLLIIPLKGLPSMLVTANSVAKNEVPSFDDAWQAALDKIAESSDKAIISSWWDFGHWFEARSERSVTFDGGDQGKRIYWIGRSLLTDDENESIDILKMLNCGQEESYNLLEKYIGDKFRATKLLQDAIKLDREDAKTAYINAGLTETQAEEVLKLSHCEDLIDMYYITSEDMIGKAGVWGHFGSWDFNRAYIYYKLGALSLDDAIAVGESDLGLTADETKALYFESQKIRTQDNAERRANDWISPWPNYVTGKPVNCKEVPDDENAVVCEYNIGLGRQENANTILWRGIINLTKPEDSILVVRAVDATSGNLLGQNAIRPSGIVIGEENGLVRYPVENSTFGYDVSLFKNKAGTYQSLIADPLLSRSVFTKLFLMEGQYTKHFEKVFDGRDFRQQRIIVWKVNP